VTRCKHHQLLRTPLRSVAAALAHLFGPTSAGCTAKGSASTSTACSVAVIKVHQPKLLSLDLNLAPTTYQPHGSSTFWSTPFILVFVTAQLRTCCVRSANVVCWDIHLARPRPPGKELAREMRDHPEIREATIKLRPTCNCQPPRDGRVSPTSGQEITYSKDICQMVRA
jgi:hypothetical protein